jgi:hypothetical protein
MHSLHEIGKPFGGIANQADGEWLTLIAGLSYLVKCLVQGACHFITVASIEASLDMMQVNLHGQADTFVHGYCQWLHAFSQMPLNESSCYPP